MTQTQPPRPTAAPQTALVPIETSTQAIALVPQSLDGAMQLARWLATSSFLPEKLRGKEADVFAIVLAGVELGLPPMAALRGIYVVNGRTALESRTKAAICIQRGAAVYIRRTEHTPLATTWETLRRGETEPRSYRYTRQEAEASGLTRKDGPWQQFPQRMISHRALGWLCDDAYPDVVLGVATAEDFNDDEITFAPIAQLGGGVELGTVPQRSAPAQPATETGARRDPAPTHGSGGAAATGGKPMLTEDDVIDLLTQIGNAGTEASLKPIGARIGSSAMSEEHRAKLKASYADQLAEIRKANAAEHAEKPA